MTLSVPARFGAPRQVIAVRPPSRRYEVIYRDSKIGEIYEGAHENLKWVAARTIFGKETIG